MIQRLKIFVLFYFVIFSLFACKKTNDENISLERKVDIESGINIQTDTVDYNDISFETHDIGLYGAKIYVFKNQSGGQILSIVIRTIDNKCIVVDGGRIEDADFLFNFLKENFDGCVKHWFITHCHDDHVGALYAILDKYKDSLFIENIYYKFPDVFYAYNVIGLDAGIITLMQNKISEYSQFVIEKISAKSTDINIDSSSQNNFQPCIVYNDIKAHDIIKENLLDIEIMNDMYAIENDLLNNSSVTYKITFKNQKNYDQKKTMFVLGDLAYEGGCKLLEDYKDNIDDLKSDICILAHHGQGGVDKKVYAVINPTYVIWPTIHDIYDNVYKKYHTDDTKKWLDDIKVKKHFTTIDENILLK